MLLKLSKNLKQERPIKPKKQHEKPPKVQRCFVFTGSAEAQRAILSWVGIFEKTTETEAEKRVAKTIIEPIVIEMK